MYQWVLQTSVADTVYTTAFFVYLLPPRILYLIHAGPLRSKHSVTKIINRLRYKMLSAISRYNCWWHNSSPLQTCKFFFIFYIFVVLFGLPVSFFLQSLLQHTFCNFTFIFHSSDVPYQVDWLILVSSFIGNEVAIISPVSTFRILSNVSFSSTLDLKQLSNTRSSEVMIDVSNKLIMTTYVLQYNVSRFTPNLFVMSLHLFIIYNKNLWKRWSTRDIMGVTYTSRDDVRNKQWI